MISPTNFYEFRPAPQGDGSLGYIYQVPASGTNDVLTIIVFDDTFHVNSATFPVDARLLAFIEAIQTNQWQEATREEEYYENIVRDLLVTAWEGGSAYWAQVDEQMGAEATFNEMWQGWYILRVRDDEGEWHGVSYHDLFHALQRMRREFPDRFQSIMDGSYDADDADIWFQLAVLGELTYA